MRLMHFFKRLDSRNRREHETVKLFKRQDSKNEQDHETVAFFKLLHNKNQREHETVAFIQASRQQKRARTRDCLIFHTSRQQTRAGTRDCRIFLHFQTATASRNARQLQSLMFHYTFEAPKKASLWLPSADKTRSHTITLIAGAIFCKIIPYGRQRNFSFLEV